ncbi:MAG: alpha-2-macroglobulin [Bacteroidetes bacterium]|nr:alpha-2-macroglobulin [Bacteroidota bacterium]
MRKIILMLLIIAISQQTDAQNNMNPKYDVKWKAVEAAFQKGLNKTAQSEIEAILKMAKAENNTEQTIKALCNYRVSLQDRDEKSRLNDLLFFEKEIKTSTFPTKQLLHSMLGDLYWTYYQENRWKILDRTKVENTTDPNSTPTLAIETWSADDFYQEANKNFMASLTESTLSKSYPIKNVNILFEPGKNTDKLRPTLYDLLVHRAIDYFSNDENELTKPANTFEINDENAIAPASTFIKTNFKTNDKTSQKYHVLTLYQDILSFHENDADPSALIDADIARIQYVYENSISKTKNESYKKALKYIADTYPSNELAAMANVLYAETFIQGGQHVGRKGYFNSSIDESKINYVEAKRLCEAIIAKFPHSEASSRAESILQQIEQRSLGINVEKVIVPNQPSLAKIIYKEVKTLYCKIVPLTIQEMKDKTYDYNNDYQAIVSKKGIKNWSVNLPDKHDYKGHSTEIKIDALPLGTYAVIISEDANFDYKKHYATAFLRVSNLANVQMTEQDKNGTGIYIVNRTTGEPIENVSIKTWVHYYDYSTRKYKAKQGPSFTTNKEGYANMQRTNPHEGGYALELSKGDDVLFLDDNFYINEYNQQPDNDYVRTFLFTDRSIYRPGQTIYFKGITVMQKTRGENKSYEVLKDRKTSVTLKDANYQEVKTIELTTNEYGSFTGTFVAPEGLLTGQFQIVAESGQTYFNIEEYKRPKFEVSYDTLKGSYQLNDIIKIKGIAKAYAGNNIDAATVKYRVVRNARFPYYWCFYRWGQPSSPSMEIAHGSTKTKNDGTFDIDFKAIADESIDPQTKPIFDYTVYADVTDLNGETRSGETQVSVAYESLWLKIETPEQVDYNNFNAVKVFSTNLANTYIPTQVTLTLKKLVSPTKTYRKRMWDKVEINAISETDFRKDFPLDEYNNENDYLQWATERIVWTKTFTTTKEGLEYLQKTGANQGWFVLEAKATDQNGNEVLDKKYIRLSSFAHAEALPNEHLLVTKVKMLAAPGETATIHLSVPYEKVYTLCHYLKQTQIMEVNNAKKAGFASGEKTEWLTLDRNKTFEFKITEADYGGFYLLGWYIKNNRYYAYNEFIDVPWNNKALKISLQTFRDKMLPGSQQEWTLKISGHQKESVSAELLATMYDASLDAFKPHQWQGFDFFRARYNKIHFNTASNFQIESGRPFYFGGFKEVHPYEKTYRSLKWWGLNNGGTYYMLDGIRMKGGRGVIREGGVTMNDIGTDAPAPMMTKSVALGKANESEDESFKLPNVIMQSPSKEESANSPIPLRSNFAETAFFFPQIHTDAEGNILLKFKAPDALTRWKLMAFAHTKEIQSGSLTETSTTSKELMIVPNTPRFFREGDKMIYSAKVTNLSEKDIQGKVTLQLIDAISENVQDSLFKNHANVVTLNIKKGQSERVEWRIEIPTGFTHPIKIITMAEAGDFSDGEQNIVPVLLNSMLVTETLPLPVRMNTSKDFTFKNLLNASKSNTIRHYNLTLEYTSNPAWYAVQALPYLTDYPYECAEQTFNRYYANALATHIANASPKVKEIFSTWENKDTAALLSNLQKNQALKSALLQETPWVLEAKNETEQKRNLANLFNLNRMSKELERTVRELENMQTPNGGFTWFKGMPDDRFMTQYILTGIGRLMHLGIAEVGSERRILQIVERALPYLDARIKEDYDELKKNARDLNLAYIDYTHIQYLYMRSFFKENEVSAASKTAFEYYKKQAATYWLKGNKYMQGMTALALNRWDDKTTPKNILQSLRENAIRNEEMGMYWKENTGSWWWYEAPIETQSLLVEVFKEIGGDDQEVDELKIWLLKNKQTQHWKTSKATADAVYALLLNGTYWLSTQPDVSIQLGNKTILSKEQKQEAGTGYFKMSIPQDEINAGMGKIHVDVKNNASVGKDIGGTTWGAVYWQYFEQLDKIESHETPLSLKKQLFKISLTDKGEVLTPITENSPLNIGDKVKVRIELRVDRAMEYVHMKDMRGACFEPINVLSNYKYQGGLGYYEATKDASTNFFFSWLNKGTYVFEYPMFVTNQGDYSNGIATIQCMYAPEYSSHSEGIRVIVK